jgi:hypothetical protein
MTDTATPAPAPAPAERTEPSPEVEKTDWKAEARKWEDRAKENKSAADELAAIKDAQKSEAEKVADRVAKAEERAVAAEARALRREVALEFKLTTEDAALLDTVNDEKAMRQLAERLAAAVSDRKNKNVVPSEGRTTPPPIEDEMRAFARSVFGGTQP